MVILRHSDDRKIHRIKWCFGQTKGKHEINPVQPILKEKNYYKVYLAFWGRLSFHNIGLTNTKFPFTCWQYSMIDPWNTHRSKFNPELPIGVIKRTHAPHHWGWFPWSEHKVRNKQTKLRHSFTSSLLTTVSETFLFRAMYIHKVWHLPGKEKIPKPNASLVLYKLMT